MNGITELAQSLKAAAIDAKELAIIARYSKGRAAAEKFYALANPNNVIALVEALEKAQAAQSCEHSMFWDASGVKRCSKCDLPEHANVHYADAAEMEIAALRQRIAELESRTVTVKQGEVLVTVAGFTGCGKSAIAGEIEIAMRAIGVPVTWANGDSEKRMTGADWLTAIEMYKPTVRIVEENIPRAAGIKWEGE
ncbi:TPA: ead/Ea22-like family protein [Klebsiella aerogenes]